jgi:hypothetical protein
MAIGVSGLSIRPKKRKEADEGQVNIIGGIELFDPTPKDGEDMPKEMMAMPTSLLDQQNIEEEFQDQDLKTEDMDVKIRFVSANEIGGANVQIRATLEVVELWVAKEHIFTSMALREVLGGVLQNRLHRLNNRYLAKKAKQELMK